MTRAEGFLFAPDGFLYVCEWGANQVRKFTTNGIPLGLGLTGGTLNNPNGITWGPPLDVITTRKVSFGSLKASFEP